MRKISGSSNTQLIIIMSIEEKKFSQPNNATSWFRDVAVAQAYSADVSKPAIIMLKPVVVVK